MLDKISLNIRQILPAVQVIKHWGWDGVTIVQRNINNFG